MLIVHTENNLASNNRLEELNVRRAATRQTGMTSPVPRIIHFFKLLPSAGIWTLNTLAVDKYFKEF